jgi:hypothetical protein
MRASAITRLLKEKRVLSALPLDICQPTKAGSAGLFETSRKAKAWGARVVGSFE